MVRQSAKERIPQSKDREGWKQQRIMRKTCGASDSRDNPASVLLICWASIGSYLRH